MAASTRPKGSGVTRPSNRRKSTRPRKGRTLVTGAAGLEPATPGFGDSAREGRDPLSRANLRLVRASRCASRELDDLAGESAGEVGVEAAGILDKLTLELVAVAVGHRGVG